MPITSYMRNRNDQARRNLAQQRHPRYDHEELGDNQMNNFMFNVRRHNFELNREEENSDDDHELGEDLLRKMKKMKIGKSKKSCAVCLSSLMKGRPGFRRRPRALPPVQPHLPQQVHQDLVQEALHLSALQDEREEVPREKNVVALSPGHVSNIIRSHAFGRAAVNSISSPATRKYR